MVGVLMRMKLQILGNSFTGAKAATTISGAVAGLAAAGTTIWLTAAAGPRAGDALVLTFASWLLGWLVGPMMGGADPGLRREHLHHVPLTNRQRAVGLLGSALVGVGPAVTLIAAGSLVGYGARHDVAGVAVAVVAVGLSVLLLVSLSNVIVAAVGKVLDGRLSAALMAIPWGVLVCLAAQGWVIIAAVTGGPDRALPPSIAHGLRVSPSGWPVVAVEAAGRGDWPLVLASLAGLAAVIAVALALWGLLLRRPAAPTVIRGTSSRSSWRPSSRLAAVAGKERRTWSRDLVRIHFLVFALVYALTYTLLPLLINVTDFLPMTGVFLVIMAVGCSAHLHSSDGTGLWQTLMVPDGARADVRGRQLTWLLVVGPVAVVLTLAGLLWHGRADMVPWAVGLLPIALGAGAGLFILISVYLPTRMNDPHRRGNNPAADGGGIAGIVWIALLALAVLASPVLALLAVGTVRDIELLRWSAVPLAVTLGLLIAWGFGRLAHRRLAAHGPELLTKVGTA
ncbi:hypothetical protein AB0H57_17300 [Micromonospora sp. NPDC050686]|uniref:hypothetical protein n=1 Tax=Micromonospora sp. NPDC050686 TaxID=3154631 RepID=UPI0033F32D57